MGKSVKRKTGDVYEADVASWMAKNGYKILGRNWTAPPHELDIIALKSGTVVFTEVKSGNARFFETPESRINFDKMRFIISAAKKYIRMLKEHNIDTDGLGYRFDAAAIEFDDSGKTVSFKYYENYFEAGADFPE